MELTILKNEWIWQKFALDNCKDFIYWNISNILIYSKHWIATTIFAVFIPTTGCPRKNLPKRKLYISHDTQSNATISFSFDRGTFQVLFSRKKVSQVLFEHINIHIDTRFQIFKILSKKLEILSETLFNLSFIIHPL